MTGNDRYHVFRAASTVNLLVADLVVDVMYAHQIDVVSPFRIVTGKHYFRLPPTESRIKMFTTNFNGSQERPPTTRTEGGD